jgi:hypothetical protein
VPRIQALMTGDYEIENAEGTQKTHLSKPAS